MPARKPVDPLAKLLQDIAIGKHDGNLGAILRASADRMVATSVTMRWQFDLPGCEFRQDDLKVSDLAWLEQTHGVKWSNLDVPASIVQTSLVVERWLTAHLGKTVEEAAALIEDEWGATALLEAVSYYERPPVAAP